MNTDVSSTVSDNLSNDGTDVGIGGQALNYNFRDQTYNDINSSPCIPSDISDARSNISVRSKSKPKPKPNKKIETSKGYRPRNNASVGNFK